MFKALDEYFDTDVAGPIVHTHVPCARVINSDSLNREWTGFVWMNPPYGARNSLGAWLDKFFTHGYGIALVPDRTSAPWFQDAWVKADAVLFTPKIKFERPDGTTGNSPSNGSALMAAGLRAELALKRAAAAGLGVLGTPYRMDRGRDE